jgi:hypothetical protein
MMKLNRMKMFGVLLAATLLCTGAQAASLGSNDLPSGVNWYAHVNMELIHGTDAGRQLMKKTVDEALEDIQDELGVDISSELEGITVFGGKLPVNQGAVLLHGAISSETQSVILDRLNEEQTGVFTTESSGMLYYTIPEGDGSMTYTDEDGHVEEVTWGNRENLYFSFGSRQTMITHSMETMQSFLDSGGLLSSLDSVDPHAMVVLQADRALMQGGANTTLEIGDTFDSSVFQNIESVAVVVSEENGGLNINAELLANSAEVAMNVRNIVEGLVALKALEDSGDDMGAILRNVRFESDGEKLRVFIPVAADQIEALGDL